MSLPSPLFFYIKLDESGNKCQSQVQTVGSWKLLQLLLAEM